MTSRTAAAAAALAALALVIVVSPARARAGESACARPDMADSRVAVRLCGGLSPWKEIRYEAFARDGVAVVVHARELAGRSESFLRTALLTPAEYEALWCAVTAAAPDAAPRPDRPPLPGGPQATVTIQTSGAPATAVTIPAPFGQEDPRFAAAVAAVRELALSRAGPIPFRDVFVPSESLGWLRVTSTPAAEVTIDGRPTGERTPVDRYELPAGVHELVLTNEARGIERRYDFRIQAGMTTLLELELR